MDFFGHKKLEKKLKIGKTRKLVEKEYLSDKTSNHSKSIFAEIGGRKKISLVAGRLAHSLAQCLNSHL